MNFGAAIRASRRSRKLTQAGIAALAGVSRQAIVLLESNGGRVSTLLAVQAVAPVRVMKLREGASYGSRLRSARADRSIAAIATAAGVSTNTVRAVETDCGTVATLTRVMGVVAPHAAVQPVLPQAPKKWRTVHGKVNT